MKNFAISCVRLAIWLPNALLSHQITISNLRKLVFGQGNNKNHRNKKPKNDKDNPIKDNPIKDNPIKDNPIKDNPIKDNVSTTGNENAADDNQPVNNEKTKNEHEPKARGYGRLPHSVYKNTIEHRVLVANLKSGNLCPLQCGGKLYSIDPGIIVRVKGQNLAAVHKYWIEKLRCALCGSIVSADIPSHIGIEKYDATFKALLTLQKYYVAVPFNRQAFFQSLIGMPLPASTQWQLVEEVGGAALLVFPTLERIAANGELIHNDDSHVKITDIIRHNRLHPNQERTGTFTSGFIARSQERDIAIFYNSKRHAGENMEQNMAP